MTSSQGRQNPPPANFQNHKKNSLTYNSAKPDEAHEQKEIVAWIDPRRPQQKKKKTHQQDPRKKTQLILNVTSTSSPPPPPTHTHTHKLAQTQNKERQKTKTKENKKTPVRPPTHERTHARKSRNHRLPQTRKTGDRNPLQNKIYKNYLKKHCKKQDASYKRTRCEDVRRRGAKKKTTAIGNREGKRTQQQAAAVTGEEKGCAKYKENDKSPSRYTVSQLASNTGIIKQLNSNPRITNQPLVSGSNPPPRPLLTLTPSHGCVFLTLPVFLTHTHIHTHKE
jgi:hypothetical protein